MTTPPPQHTSVEAARAWAALDAIETSSVLWDQTVYRTFYLDEDAQLLQQPGSPTHITDLATVPSSFSLYARDDIAPEILSRCKAAMCLAGIVCELDGGTWLVAIAPTGQLLFKGQPATLDELGYRSPDLLVATEQEIAEGTAITTEGEQAMLPHERARRLLGLDPSQAEALFSSGNRFDDLLRQLEQLYGPRPERPAAA
ncbi:hypothetical protein ACIBH1_44780 [Nonomuraea sp. NPDC050663]|uniref:hypothetical protein n=1 Tax=Nonomuraea sp. NPDC050663 TaxID=3364370 RepID=UPI0037A9C417